PPSSKNIDPDNGSCSHPVFLLRLLGRTLDLVAASLSFLPGSGAASRAVPQYAFWPFSIGLALHLTAFRSPPSHSGAVPPSGSPHWCVRAPLVARFSRPSASYAAAPSAHFRSDPQTFRARISLAWCPRCGSPGRACPLGR